MASVYADPRPRNKRHYIAAGAFNGAFYSYTTSLNMTTFSTVGTLAAVSGATAGNCPAGRILREVGHRLYPAAHPGISTMMVKVYDANSCLSGYIDPNAPQFAVFNSDKPIEIVDGGDSNSATPHKGQPVYTTGDVIAGGDANITGDVVAGGQVRSSTVTVDSSSTGGTLTINPTLGQVFKFTANMASAVTLAATAGSAAANPGAIVYVIFTDGGGRAIAGDGTTVKGAASATMTDNKIYTVTLVSDGAVFYQTAAVQGA
jgi:hypothetical protein